MATKINTKYLLDLVSRSFALTIPLLDKNKKNKVEVQYLLARIIDTIEDSSHTAEDKETLITAFINILKTENIDNLENFKNVVIEHSINENDKVLIENIDVVLKSFFTFKQEIKNMSISYLREMGYGMIYYQDHVISTFEDLDDYCYYVAGTVGLYLTELTKILDNLELDREKAKSLGRFLQKVNIIKDAKLDYGEKRVFWPLSLFENENPAPYFEDGAYMDKSMEILVKMIESAMSEFRNSIEYIMTIEKKAIGYRHFCLVATLMGYETIKLMKSNYNIFMGETVKIPRKNTLEIAAKVKADFYTNKRLEDLLEKAFAKESVQSESESTVNNNE
ncbi:squalene synthase [Brachyspira hampsonii]|uniref:Squalene synthase n=2 Tax=Brachyspira hampsonii TaxID=1287055 RepID=A0AAC9TU66_9SPIR|nr:squalene/phytoene synthase family protein [Brachyspira hampsonii]ASJ21946.1 squalene synthase [Brachyspira hampsonii]MBW5379807.1 squalene synthase [Brachyspira hampsonii]OEJ19511.1 squalene synthase [Brachyspira hampsonii]